jgi:hypothetical protein
MNLATTIPAAGRLAETGKAIVHGIRVNGLLYGFALFVCTAAVLESLWLGLPIDLKMLMIFTGPVILVLAVMMVMGLGFETVRLGRTGYQGSVFAALGVKLRDDYLAPGRISNALHSIMFMTIYMMGYTFMKAAIPLAMPFAWDKTFMQWDKAVHFGVHPYAALAPVLNHPAITFALNVNYNAWFFVMFCCWFWQGFGPKDTALRARFLLGFTLTWFIGSCVLGTIFSSVGPCFYGRLLPGPDPYIPLMDWLNEANQINPIWSLRIMDELWKNYASGSGALSGISAMPSMHIATSMLFAFLAFEAGKRWLGCLLSVFALVIFIGSIHLGWHYAIDGYAGAAVAVFGWWAAGKLVTWDRRRRGVA